MHRLVLLFELKYQFFLAISDQLTTETSVLHQDTWFVNPDDDELSKRVVCEQNCFAKSIFVKHEVIQLSSFNMRMSGAGRIVVKIQF